MTELLVSVAIVLVLSTIATVAALSARKSALQSRCITNLSQIGKATLLYAADHDDFLPPYLTSVSNFDPSRPGISGADFWRRSLEKYAGKDVWFCPADQSRSSADGQSVTDKRFTTYYTSFKLVGRNGSAYPLKTQLSQISQPSDEPLAMDSPTAREGSGADVKVYTGHGLRFGVVFCDGRARVLTFPGTMRSDP